VRLELDGITAGYGDAVVLRDVSLTVPAGRVVALLGPNGAGKTTTLSVASGLVAPSAGQVRVDGVDVAGTRPHRLAELGLCHVTEAGAIFPELTVADNLRMFARSGEERDAMARAVDALPRLGERLGQVAGTLSGGEQRMLALARVYGRSPSVVLVDEISLGLAPMLVDEIFGFLGRLAASGTSLLVVEQYVGKVLALADLVYVLVRGRIEFAGEPGEVSSADLLARYLAIDHKAGAIRG
jgi:branched-chain amino acid transport system ATP-binding protein